MMTLITNTKAMISMKNLMMVKNGVIIIDGDNDQHDKVKNYRHDKVNIDQESSNHYEK